ncbi:hypothetical protein SPI_06874 [Niveomyces insectorum RCEF 264]|uniref:Tat pathway signal sequence n=1 Tax=Niveomyces insectorum RCEF 264 TaxID=1081102 RepID=A0A167QUW2_9HYPO|nr:hypothetical protein SPI_06874 [Niveomyces insectorum RCEF 264]
MAGNNHEFTDAESASFLHGEAKDEALPKGLLGGKAARWRQWSSVSRLWPYALVTAGVILAVGILVWPRPSNGSQEQHLLPSQALLGKIPKKLVVFSPDDSYDLDPFGPDGLENAWSKLPPVGKGHVKVDDPVAWKLSGGYPLEDEAAPKAEEYTIAMFHQLHCLAAIKSKMARLQQYYKGENEKNYLTFAINEEQVSDQHIYHCFDYIRQAIMCNADTTLEMARTVDGKRVRGVDGWGVAHECRDIDAIKTFATAHRTNNLTGID